MKKFAIVALSAFAVGCGVSDNAVLAEIDNATWEKICEKVTNPDDDPVECDGFTVEPATVAECVDANDGAWSEGSCTFGDWRACQEAIDDADPCTMTELPSACDPLGDCATPAEM